MQTRLGDTERCCDLPYAAPGLDKIQSFTAERSRIRLGHNASLLRRYQARSLSTTESGKPGEDQGVRQTGGSSWRLDHWTRMIRHPIGLPPRSKRASMLISFSS